MRCCPSKIRKDVEAMKRFRVFYGGLAGLAAACALGAWFAPVEAGWLAFPWVSIGAGLRVLSLSGSVGNVAACGLYALLCLLPAGIALRDIRHHWPLVGFSAVLGPALYFLINPGLLAQRMGGLPQEVVVAMLGQLIWAVALACAVWLLLGVLHRRSLNTSSLLHGMQIGLCLLDGAFVVSVFGVGVLDLRGQIAAVRQANTMLDNTAFGTLNPTALFLVCGWLVQSLPALLNLGIVHGLLQLVKLAKADRFAPGMAQAAAHCGTLAGGAAAVDVTVQAVFLAVQLCAAGQLHQLNSGLHIALLPILFAVAALLFSRRLRPAGRKRGVHLMAIKVYLDEQLRARGITAKELCARVGITEANLSILRSGKAKGVRFHTINRICYYLQCDVGDILKFDGELDEGDCDET